MFILSKRWRSSEKQKENKKEIKTERKINMKKIIALLIAVIMIVSVAGCSAQTNSKTDFSIGICNYVDDASLNQIIASMKSRLDELSAEKGVTIAVNDDNCNADANVMSQIIANFQANNVDLMVGVATPVAMAMQSATEGTDTPVVFAAVSDPVGTQLVESYEAPGSNVTGTCDYLDTKAIMNLIFAVNPDARRIGLLYDIGQDASTAAIAEAKEYLEAKGVEIIERTGTNVDEVTLAVEALIADKVDAVFTPTDNTIMNAQYSIYDKFIEAGIPHYAGANSFALNGAFVGYGVDYERLGKETADMIFDILVNGKDPASTPVKTFDNGTATVNTETCKALGYDYDLVCAKFTPFCNKIESITTAESFDELN